MRKRTSIKVRLERKRSIGAAGCWEWMGYLTPKGYGLIRDENSKLSYTHREAYLAYVGPIPAGLHVDHLCRNRACFNPAHLEPVTPRENARRGLTGQHLRKEVA